MRQVLTLIHSSICKAISHIRRHSLLMPTLLSSLSFTGAVLLILSIWFTHNVIGTMEQTLYERAAFSSSKAANMLVRSFQGIIDTATHLETISGISPRAYSNDPYHAYQTLRLLNSAEYSDLLLCYENSPHLLTVYGTCSIPVYFSELDDPQRLVEQIHSANNTGLLSTLAFGASMDNSRLLLYYPLSSQHTAVFVLSPSLMTNTVSIAAGSLDDIQVLYNSSGAVLWSSQQIAQSHQQQIYALATSNVNSTRIKLDATEYFLSANDVGYGATLVTLEKITTQLDGLKMTITMLIVSCVLIILLGVLLLIYNIRRSYAPIASLVQDLRNVLPESPELADNDLATLRHAYSQYSVLLQENQKNAALFSPSQLRSLFVLRVISGQYTDASELHTLCQHLQISFPHEYYFACLLLLDGISNEQDKQDIESCLYKQRDDSFHFYFYLMPDGNSAVGLVNVPSSNSDQLNLFGDYIIANLPPNAHATIGIGQIYPSITNLGKSYLEAHAALDYRLIKGRNTWITYSEICFKDADSRYPHSLIQDFIATIKTWDVAKVRKELQEISNYIVYHKLPLQQVKCICFDLTSSFLREISTLDQHVMFKLGTSYDVFSIAEYDSVSELSQKIVNFSENIQQYISKRSTYQSNDLIIQCQEYMRANISNAQFSLVACADRFNTSPQTLRRKFKEATGQTLSSYMTSLRIEHARALLIHSTLDINEICAQCGYLDLSSFIRLFKSETGTSPGKYRELNRQNKT